MESPDTSFNALVQRTLVDELSLTRRVQLNARIAETMEELSEDDVEANAVQLAHHFGEAQTLLGVERLVKYSKMAGEQALAAYAYEEAMAHFERALAAKEGLPIDAETAAILFGQPMPPSLRITSAKRRPCWA